MNYSSVATSLPLPVLTGALGGITPQLYELEGAYERVSVSENLAEVAVFPARQALKALANFPANWDGFGSDAPSGEAVGNALELVVELYRQSTVCLHAQWVNPHVSASESGEVVFEWWRRDRKLTIYVAADRADFVRVGGPNIDADMFDGVLEGSQFVGLWLWLNA